MCFKNVSPRSNEGSRLCNKVQDSELPGAFTILQNMRHSRQHKLSVCWLISSTCCIVLAGSLEGAILWFQEIEACATVHQNGSPRSRVMLAQQSEGRAMKKGLAFGRELDNISCT